MNKLFKTKWIHMGFDIGLALKGLNAAAEILCGVGLIFLDPYRMNRILWFIFRSELADDPGDILMKYLAAFGDSFTKDTQNFFIFYMLSHGITKMIAVFFLWRGKLWAYPLAIFIFICFIAYQMERYFSTRSVMMLLLTLLDIVMIFLTVMECMRVRSESGDKS